MSEYRKMEVELVKSNKKNVINIYDLTDVMTKEDNYCRFCLYYNKDELNITAPFKPTLCCPNNRVRLKGFFIPLYCSIDGFHNHYKCKICKTEWIYKIQNILKEQTVEIVSSIYT
jgi:hypothetical protein